MTSVPQRTNGRRRLDTEAVLRSHPVIRNKVVPAMATLPGRRDSHPPGAPGRQNHRAVPSLADRPAHAQRAPLLRRTHFRFRLAARDVWTRIYRPRILLRWCARCRRQRSRVIQVKIF